MTEGSPPIEVFCSYAHKDEVWLRKLIIHLRFLEHERSLLIWHDRLLKGGMDWMQEIDDRLNRSRLILLLISPDFVASDYCYGIEMRRALERHEAHEAHVIPILVRPIGNWQNAPFAHLQALPPGKFLIEWSEREEDIPFAQIANGIHEILKDLPTQAVSVPHTNQPIIWNIPYPRNPFFIGREELLSRLHQQLKVGQALALSQSPQAISGLGGIGKTQLAVEYAYRHQQEYQAVLWAHAETTEALTASYTEIAKLLQLPQKDAQEQEVIIQGVKDWLSHQQNWLLILDNADEPDVLIPFLPLRMGGHLIVTTRAADLSHLGLGFGHVLTVEKFTKHQDVPFLLRRAGRKQVSSLNRTYARRIADELDGLPLALNQAGVYLATTGCSLASYWETYQQQRATLLNTQGDREYLRSAAKTLLLSFERVEQRSHAAADLLRLCAFLAPEAIPEELLTIGAKELGEELALVATDAIQFDQAIKELRAYSLLVRDPQTRTLTVHRLVQAVLRDSMAVEAQQQWTQRVLLAVNTAFPTSEQRTWPQCERLLPHALVAARNIEQFLVMNKEAGHLLHKTAYYLQNRVRYTEAESLYLQALRILEQQLGSEHPDVAQTLNGLGRLYYDQGKYTEVEPLYQRALAILQQLGPEHLDVAQTLNNLAILYYETGKFEKEELLLRQALHIREQQLGSEHPDVAQVLSRLANHYRRSGEYTAAKSLYQRALAILQQLGPEHLDVAQTLNNLAILYHETDKYTEAEPLYQQALRIWEHQLGPEHPFIAYTLSNLADLYRKQGQYAKAEPYLWQALRICEQQLGPEHHGVAYPLSNLAILYSEQGRYAEAEPLYLRALQICEQQVGPEHLDVAEVLHELARLYLRQEKYKRAEPLFLRAISIYGQKLGMENETAQTVQEEHAALLQFVKEDKEEGKS